MGKQSMSKSVLESLAKQLGDVTQSVAHRYGVQDDRGITMDCLKITAVGPGEYLGVSHAMRDEVFTLNLSRSTDLMNWRHVTTLDNHASQGEMLRERDGAFLVAYEHDEPNSCFVRLRRYANREALEKGKFATEITLGRTLAPTAEGTPSIERVERDAVHLRFHYYRNGDVDRAAKGVLTGWRDWKTQVDPGINEALEGFGCKGNIGGRSRFAFQGKPYYLHEGQLGRLDWASWRVFLLDGTERNGQRPAVRVPMKTHKGSQSFANPAITALNEPGKPPRYFVTFFMPTEGNAAGERGELAYIVEPKG